MRLDIYLHKFDFALSRSNASNLIKLGNVSVNGQIIRKTSFDINPELKYDIIIDNKDNYASLGGVKLKKALDFWQIDVKDKIVLDIGASNGGFTDLLLKNGAKKVYAVDVGKCALNQELIDNERVKVVDKTNARDMPFNVIGEIGYIIVIDVSFISLKLILPNIKQFMGNMTKVIALIKPQFEAGKSALNKKGIVKNSKIIDEVLADIKKFSLNCGFEVNDLIKAPHDFIKKNQEFLIYLT